MNIEFFKTKKDFNKKGYQLNLSVYWKIILFSIFLIIMLSFFYGYNLFIEINKDFVITNTDTNDQVENRRQKRIQNILKYFSDRETNSFNIINSPPSIVDPSI